MAAGELSTSAIISYPQVLIGIWSIVNGSWYGLEKINKTDVLT